MSGDYVVSFLDLIDTYVVGRFREAGVKMSTVRQAYEILESDWGTQHPFAHSKLYTDGKNVIVGAASKLADELLYDAITKQMLFLELRGRLERIDYSDHTHLAARWRIAAGVMIDPEISFGKPVIQGTGTQTWIVARQYHANRQNAGLVGDLFGISENDVKNAVQFEAKIARSLAA